MKYRIRDEGERDDIRQFAVTEGDQREWEAVGVWVSKGNPKPRCCECSGPLVAMSASCPHAKAVKRWLQKQDRRQAHQARR
jgi:hypothetical protein